MDPFLDVFVEVFVDFFVDVGEVVGIHLVKWNIVVYRLHQVHFILQFGYSVFLVLAISSPSVVHSIVFVPGDRLRLEQRAPACARLRPNVCDHETVSKRQGHCFSLDASL